jgi:hypothetical protein
VTPWFLKKITYRGDEFAPGHDGFGLVNLPLRLARTLQLSRITSQAAAAACGPERIIRRSAACTRRSSAMLLHSLERRRSVAP